jgi:hypothetical protein
MKIAILLSVFIFVPIVIVAQAYRFTSEDIQTENEYANNNEPEKMSGFIISVINGIRKDNFGSPPLQNDTFLTLMAKSYAESFAKEQSNAEFVPSTPSVFWIYFPVVNNNCPLLTISSMWSDRFNTAFYDKEVTGFGFWITEDPYDKNKHHAVFVLRPKLRPK